jgi:hypothetical protein
MEKLKIQSLKENYKKLRNIKTLKQVKSHFTKKTKRTHLLIYSNYNYKVSYHSLINYFTCLGEETNVLERKIDKKS